MGVCGDLSGHTLRHSETLLVGPARFPVLQPLASGKILSRTVLVLSSRRTDCPVANTGPQWQCLTILSVSQVGIDVVPFQQPLYHLRMPISGRPQSRCLTIFVVSCVGVNVILFQQCLDHCLMTIASSPQVPRSARFGISYVGADLVSVCNSPGLR